MGNVVALGGGFDIESADRWKIAKYLFSLANKQKPNFLLIAAPGFDSYGSNELSRFFALGCDVDVLLISRDSQAEVAEKIRKADIIYMPGGNSTYPIAMFKKRECDKYLREAFDETATVLSGKCAGAMFWFTESYDNDEPDDGFAFIEPLGFIDYCMCPHYDSPEWAGFNEAVKTRSRSGLAIDNGAAMCFLGEKREIFRCRGYEKVYLFDKDKNFERIDLTAHPEILKNL